MNKKELFRLKLGSNIDKFLNRNTNTEEFKDSIMNLFEEFIPLMKMDLFDKKGNYLMTVIAHNENQAKEVLGDTKYDKRIDWSKSKLRALD
jgi:hypothetical protein